MATLAQGHVGTVVSTEESGYSIYRRLVSQLMNGEEQLPSLPMITMEIRRALANPDASTSSLARVINKDPALSATLVKHAASTRLRTALPPKTLEDVIRTLGMLEVDRITMVHSIKSLFTLHSASHKKLFVHTWSRLARRGSISAVLARLLGHASSEHVLLASVLSDIGALAILSAFKDAQQIPSPELYSRLCREYGKSLGVIVLKKWAVDDSYIAVVRGLGAWDESSGPGVELVDLINLGLFHALREAGPTALLPPLRELAAYRKLQPPLNALDPSGNGLALVASQRAEIQRVESLLQ